MINDMGGRDGRHETTSREIQVRQQGPGGPGGPERGGAGRSDQRDGGPGQPERAGPAPGERLLTPEIVRLAAVVVLGSIMTILDATIVNVALPTLGREFGTSISVIQWVPTAYLLAFASVIPLTGWASERFGARRVWLSSLAAFMLGSLLCGLAGSVTGLIVFRVLQGLGGGMIMPVGQAILARAAGPARIGRVMSIVGVPLLLGPVVGPVIGGTIVGAASWRWIFFVNLPVGAAALALALWLLPAVPGRPQARLDVRGLVLASGGIAALIYGLGQVATGGASHGPAPAAAVVAGIGLVASFGIHALRAPRPLIDIRLFARRGFAAGALTNLVLGMALFGVSLLLPLYLEIVRGRTPLQTGLLLVPQGLGAALAMPAAGSLTDKIGARPVVITGIGLAVAGTAACTQLTAATPDAYLAGALLLIGAGLGATITPSMAAAFQAAGRAAIGSATSAIGTIQRLAASLGTALLAVTLQRAMTAGRPGFGGGIARAGALAVGRPGARPVLAHAFGVTFWLALALTAAALVPALLLPAGPARPAPRPAGPARS
jgi:EmrB/QacA subfamily drug resistance transporter